jgi:hypothetical protein
MFGEAVKRADNSYSGCENIIHHVFVNGLLPYPIYGTPKCDDQIGNFIRYNREMAMLIHYSPQIHFVPMRQAAVRYCEDMGIKLKDLFRDDKVHLTKQGESFLIDHIVYQARMFRAALGQCVGADDLTFFHNTASLSRTKTENYRNIVKEYVIT